jgi:hypothetical protein
VSVGGAVSAAAFDPKMVGALANSLFQILHHHSPLPLAELGNAWLENSKRASRMTSRNLALMGARRKELARFRKVLSI